MNYLVSLTVSSLLLCFANGQFENGFVKILEDQRYQDGAAFGNFRNQEDGIVFKEETAVNGARKGFWQYPDETGKIVRVEFIAGPRIGFRIVNSNIVDATSVAQPAPKPVVGQPIKPVVEPVQKKPIVQTRVAEVPVVRQQLQPAVEKIVPVSTTPKPINIFDYPADLQFFRDATGHRFKFSAL